MQDVPLGASGAIGEAVSFGQLRIVQSVARDLLAPADPSSSQALGDWLGTRPADAEAASVVLAPIAYQPLAAIGMPSPLSVPGAGAGAGALRGASPHGGEAAIGVLAVVLPSAALATLDDSHMTVVAAVAHHLGLALALQRDAEEALRPPPTRTFPGAFPGTCSVGLRGGEPQKANSTQDDPSLMPSLATSLAQLMLELDPQQSASLGKMLSHHPALGDEVMSRITAAAHTEAVEATRAGGCCSGSQRHDA